MVTTFEAIGVFVLAGLPGAMYIWGWERQVGQWGISAVDRLLRFVAGSAILHAMFLPVTYVVWERFIRTGRLKAAHDIPLWLWPVAIGYVFVPYLAGIVAATTLRSRRKWARRASHLLNGLDPAPRAWDHVFGPPSQTAWIRLKLNDGTWLGGRWVRFDVDWSYASGYPYDQELYLCQSVGVNGTTGAFLEPVETGPGVLIRWSEVQYLVWDAEPDEAAAGRT